MTRLPSRFDAASSAAAENRTAVLALLEQVDAAAREAVAGGGARAVERHRRRNKLTIRERIERLIDRDSPLLELSPCAGWGTADPLGGSTVSAIGVVAGTECVLLGNDPTVKGGAVNPTAVAKSLRAMEIARENRLPVVNLTESAGADLPRQAEIFVAGGALFRDLTQLSAAGIPTVTIVFGSSTAGGAYMPGMSDHTVLVRGRSQVFLGGPPLVRMAIDEIVDEETLGGAEMHARESGLADHLAADELDALRTARAVLRRIRWRKAGPGPTLPASPPRHDPEDLLALAPIDLRAPFAVREVLARVLDDSEFDEFKPRYGTQLVAGWGSVHGFPVGVLANEGILFSQEAQKGAHFIQLCNRSDTPILFLQHITGFMVGSAAERGGIIKDGAKLINAVANSGVPHITVMLGASYGAGNYGMAGRAYRPRFVFSWPGHRIAVMGGKQLAGVLSIVQRGAAAAAGREYDEEAGAAVQAAVEAQIEAESTALFATGHLWDDGIVDPRDTRTVLGIALSAVHSAPVRGAERFGVFRM